jgi:hypothetical protein
VNKVPANVIASQNSPQLTRVVTPAARSAAPPRVPARACNLSPRNLSQGDFMEKGSDSRAMASSNPNVPVINTVPHKATANEKQYKDLMKHPTLVSYYKIGLGNELGHLFQWIIEIQDTYTCFFVKLTNIPRDLKITYGKHLFDYKHNKAEKERVRLTVGGNTLDCIGDVETSTANIAPLKSIINFTLSTEDAEMMMMMMDKKLLFGNNFTHI